MRRAIEGMRGSIDIASELGKGSTFTLRLPLTLAIIEGLLVRVAETRYVVPLTAVEECVELSAAADARSKGRSFLNIRGELVPFLRLRELFAESGEPRSHQKVVIVANADVRVGLVVDQIIGSHQTVIKSLSKLHADAPSFSGATILGDGAVALILDVPHLIAAGQMREARLKSVRPGGRMMSQLETASQALMLGLAGEVFAIDAKQVREILDPIPVTRVPGAKPYVANLINVRGKVIPLADLRLRFGMPPAPITPDSRFIVLEIDLGGDAHDHRDHRRQGLRGHRARRLDAAEDAACRHALAARVRRRDRQVEGRVHRPSRHGEDFGFRRTLNTRLRIEANPGSSAAPKAFESAGAALGRGRDKAHSSGAGFKQNRGIERCDSRSKPNWRAPSAPSSSLSMLTGGVAYVKMSSSRTSARRWRPAPIASTRPATCRACW